MALIAIESIDTATTAKEWIAICRAYSKNEKAWTHGEVIKRYRDRTEELIPLKEVVSISTSSIVDDRTSGIHSTWNNHHVCLCVEGLFREQS